MDISPNNPLWEKWMMMVNAEKKRVKVIFSDGTPSIIGRCVCFTSPLDNDPEIASIDVESGGTLYCLYENEIKDILVLTEQDN